MISAYSKGIIIVTFSLITMPNVFFLIHDRHHYLPFIAFAEKSESETNSLQKQDFQIGEIEWLEARFPAGGTGTIRVIDNDMNLNSEIVESFDITVWSDSDKVGIDLTVYETENDSGIFEGTTFFSTKDDHQDKDSE